MFLSKWTLECVNVIDSLLLYKEASCSFPSAFLYWQDVER